jgi:hypothetical protein
MTRPIEVFREPLRAVVWLCLAGSAAWVGCGGSGSTDVAPSPTQTATSLTAAGPRFKVATWNIRSGMGIHGFATTGWSSDTLNCTDRSQPLNAWGMGLPQRELQAIRGDTSIVALAVQESWNCGAPAAVNSVLGFAGASQERNGVALFARYGFSGPVVYQQIFTNNSWTVGGDVCLDAGCTRAVPMFSTHFGAPGDGVVRQAQRVLETLAGRPSPRLFMGDLNVFALDPWNPSVPCTGQPPATHTQTLGAIEGAGYLDAWKATQSGEGWTGMATRNNCGEPNGNLFKRIDYVFVHGLVPLATARFARVAPGADAPSDHAGLIAELAIR